MRLCESVPMEEPDKFIVADLNHFVELVGQNRVGVYWSVLSGIGPEWIGSRREIGFFVDGTTMAENKLTKRLADLLIEGLSIPATSKDYLITGEGDLRRNGMLIEVVYDLTKGVPYDEPVETAGGVFALLNLEQ